LDIISDKLGIDPLEFRFKNVTRTGDTTVVGQNITSCGLEEGLKKVAEHVDWEEKRKKTPNRGMGLACGMSWGPEGGPLCRLRCLCQGFRGWWRQN
jgi:CO/xanthine dehydrogenase Mo-binding subunit